MLEGMTAKIRENYRRARARETRFIMSFSLPRLNKNLVILLLVFVTLNALDVLTTLVAINAGPAFVEFNPIASRLFGMSYYGFLAALALKYSPLAPLTYVTFLRETTSRQLAFRMVKVAAFVALSAGVVFYLFVVGSNLRMLLNYYR
jgi:hypothetical protein